MGHLFGRLISGQRPMRGFMDPLQSLDGSLPGFGLWPHAAAPVGSFGVDSIRPGQTLQPVARTTRRVAKSYLRFCGEKVTLVLTIWSPSLVIL
jgi:hypothetical protein